MSAIEVFCFHEKKRWVWKMWNKHNQE